MITIKSEREIELMRKAGMLVSEMHKFIKPYIKEGITTKELDKLCEDFITSRDAVCSCKGYQGYPATLCTSVNEVVVHGIPNGRKLKNGDIIEITDLSDRTLEYEVYDKYVVEPSNTDCTTQRTNGMKEITLITCTDDSKQRVIIKAREKIN